MKKTIATMVVTVDHIRERLGPRAGLDPDGIELAHEAANLATLLRAAKSVPLKRSEFADIVDRVARLDVRAKAHIEMHRIGRVAERLPQSMRPTVHAREDMLAALEGPSKVTLTECPACSGCTLCLDARFVTPAIAHEFEVRNTPRRDRTTMTPPGKPKGD